MLIAYLPHPKFTSEFNTKQKKVTSLEPNFSQFCIDNNISVKNDPNTPPANYPPSLEPIFENLLKRTNYPP